MRKKIERMGVKHFDCKSCSLKCRIDFRPLSQFQKHFFVRIKNDRNLYFFYERLVEFTYKKFYFSEESFYHNSGIKKTLKFLI
jgi:hypothetical protein